MEIPGRVIALLATVPLAGCAHSGIERNAHVPIPGYVCEIPGEGFDKRARAEVRSDGTLFRQDITLRMRWQPDGVSLHMGELFGPEYLPPTITAILSYPAPPQEGRRIPKTQLALTTESGPAAFARARLRGQEREGVTPTLFLAFGDLLALAKGSEQLFLLARKDGDEEVVTSKLPQSNIIAAAREFEEMRVQLTTLIENFKQDCTKVEDLDPQFILV